MVSPGNLESGHEHIAGTLNGCISIKDKYGDNFVLLSPKGFTPVISKKNFSVGAYVAIRDLHRFN
jgi:hypothetical protein